MSTRHQVTTDLYAPPEYADQSWRSFGMDTEAGRMLNKLYAGSLKPTINYPPVRVRKSSQNGTKPTFIPGGGNVNVDARLKQRKDTSSMFVPKVGRGAKPRKSHAIDCITKRKTKKEIFQKRGEDEVQRMRYRPPLRKAVATESNKRLLQATFQFKGGKCLPETGTMQAMDGHLPLQLVTGKPSFARQRAAQAKAAAAAEATAQENAADPNFAKLLRFEQDFEEVMDEIDERKKFLDDMLQYGNKEVTKHKDKAMAEIGGLVRRAKELDKKIKKLTK